MEHRIVVLQRGWGTTKGLPELAKNGPLSETKLDPHEGEIRAHRLAVVMTLKTEHEEWN